MADPDILDKELSWLSFNERVLQEAGNPEVPLIERVRYLGITSNNQDEFFRVRVADVSRLAQFSRNAETKESYKLLLERIQQRALKLQKLYDKTYSQVIQDLRKRKIYLVNEKQLDQHQHKKVTQIFERTVLPELAPIIIESNKTFPEITDGSIYLAVRITDTSDKLHYAVVKVPTDRLSRFIQIPNRKGKGGKVFIVLENVIRTSLEKVFRGIFDIKVVDAYEFKVTRDAELAIGEGIDHSLLDRIERSLKKRQNADPERFQYDSAMPEDLIKLLRSGLGLSKYDSEMPGSRYHNAKDFMSFPAVGPAYLEFKPLHPVPVPELLDEFDNIFSRIRDRDILLYYPYHSFDTVINLLKTAAIDPAVKSIDICLYRAASNSKIVQALINAKNNGKKVSAVLELQARFDEQANITWARELTDAGVNVTFGVPGLKVHSKLILIGRQEGKVIRYYTHIGTGNFNEKSARVYTDFSLLTFDQDIGRDIQKTLEFIRYTYKHPSLKKILVSPHTNKSGLLKLIHREIDNAHAGLPAEIQIKCNNLVDSSIIGALYAASDAGVRIRIICRGMISLIPGQKALSENIEAISIVDRYLEHPRAYTFHNGGNREYYISSADLMTRNLDHRVEVTTPIRDDLHKQRIQDIFDIQWSDNVKARVLDAKQNNEYRPRKREERIRSQEAIHEYLKTGKLPHAVKQARKRWHKELMAQAKKNKPKKAK